MFCMKEKTKRTKAKITVAIIAAVVAICGIVLYFTGISGNQTKTGNKIDIFDPDSFKPGARGTISVYYDGLGQMDKETSFGTVYNDDETVIIILDGLNLSYYNVSRFLLTPDENGYVDLTVSVEECPEDERQKVVQFFNDQNLMTYEYIQGEEDVNPDTLAYFEQMCSDEGKAMVDSSVSHCKCKVENTNKGSLKTVGTVMAVIGIVTALIALLLIKLSPKAIILGIVIIIFAAAVTLAVIYRKRISTYASLKKYAPGVYALNCQADYKLQDVLDAGISNESELMALLSDKLLWGVPVNLEGNSFGCSAFSAKTPDGHSLMGRNYDYPETDVLMIYTDPADGYASISMADIGLLGLGTDEGEIDPLSAGARFASLLFPYVSVDGINEAGVGIAILQLDHEETHQDKGRPDILLSVAVRAILDTCGSTDEALAFLGSYDMHMMIDRSFHLFITDRTGRSVTVEWIDNEMVVTEGCAVTNHLLGSIVTEPDIDSETRYRILTDDITACAGTADEMAAMSFLSDAALRSDDPGRMQTEWSCVYDLNDFKVIICTDTGYDQSFTVTPETFGSVR